MMKTHAVHLVSILLSGMLLSACSTTHHMRRVEFPAHVNKRADVFLKNAAPQKAAGLWAREDSLLVHRMKGKDTVLAWADVQKITVRERGKGAWKGAKWGFWAVFIGTVGGATISGLNDPYWGNVIIVISPFIGAVYGLLFGAPAGALIGAAIPPEDIYIFSDSTLASPSPARAGENP